MATRKLPANTRRVVLTVPEAMHAAVVKLVDAGCVDTGCVKAGVKLRRQLCHTQYLNLLLSGLDGMTDYAEHWLALLPKAQAALDAWFADNRDSDRIDYGGEDSGIDYGTPAWDVLIEYAMSVASGPVTQHELREYIAAETARWTSLKAALVTTVRARRTQW